MYYSQDGYRWVVAGLAAALILLIGIAVLVPPLIPESKAQPSLLVKPIEPIQLVFEDPEEERSRQIVSIDAPATPDRPDDADYEDRVNRSVDEETMARDRTLGQQVVAVSTPQHSQRRERETRREVREADETTADEVDAVAMIREQDSRDPNRREEPVDERPQERIDLSPFNPTIRNASDFIAVPGVPEIDHLDLPQGDRTQLNSIENLYWSYWDRLKTQVRPHWRPVRAYRQRDPTGRVYGVEDRYTVLRVTLNGDGSLRHVFLERSSDLDFLDREAIRAVQHAEPFSNVPEGLKDDRGLLSFRFGFFFEVGSTNFRIRREDWP